jgi:NADH-quinone oxidoreductase subunit F
MTRLLRKIEEGRGEPSDLDTLQQVATSIAPFPPIGLGTTICALGDSGALAVHGFMKFRKEFEQHIEEKRCPYGERPWGAFGDFG